MRKALDFISLQNLDHEELLRLSDELRSIAGIRRNEYWINFIKTKYHLVGRFIMLDMICSLSSIDSSPNPNWISFNLLNRWSLSIHFGGNKRMGLYGPAGLGWLVIDSSGVIIDSGCQMEEEDLCKEFYKLATAMYGVDCPVEET